MSTEYYPLRTCTRREFESYLPLEIICTQLHDKCFVNKFNERIEWFYLKSECGSVHFWTVNEVLIGFERFGANKSLPLLRMLLEKFKQKGPAGFRQIINEVCCDITDSNYYE